VKIEIVVDSRTKLCVEMSNPDHDQLFFAMWMKNLLEKFCEGGKPWEIYKVTP
jgi:hypothetical protein